MCSEPSVALQAGRNRKSRESQKGTFWGNETKETKWREQNEMKEEGEIKIGGGWMQEDCGFAELPIRYITR